MRAGKITPAASSGLPGAGAPYCQRPDIIGYYPFFCPQNKLIPQLTLIFD